MERSERRDKGAQALLVAASVVVVVAGLRAASSLLLPLLIALLLAMISYPLLSGLQRLRVPTALAVLLTLAAAVLAIGVLGILVGGSLTDFTDQVPRYKERLEELSSQLTVWLEARGLQSAPQWDAALFDPGTVLDLVTGTLRAVGTVLSNITLVLLTLCFILLEAAGLPEKFEAAFGRQERTRRFRNIRQEVQRYLGMKTLISLATGALVGIGLALLGVDFPILWGVLAFLLNYIPALGSIIAAIPPVLLATVQLGPAHAMATALLFVVVNVVLGNVVEPQLMGRRLGLSSLVVFVSLVFWGWVWGPVGMLLSVPLTMIVKIMLENTEDLRWIAVLLDAGPRRAAPPPAADDKPPATTRAR